MESVEFYGVVPIPITIAFDSTRWWKSWIFVAAAGVFGYNWILDQFLDQIPGEQWIGLDWSVSLERKFVVLSLCCTAA